MSRGKILFVDDDNFLRKVYQTELKEKGFEVSLAVDGEDGLQKVSEVQPDLIILDLIMPKKSGFEMLSDLKRFVETRSIPVIVLSNLAQSEDQKKALDLGAVDYLVKDNTTLDIIAEKIGYHLGSAKKTGPKITGATAESRTLAAALQSRKETTPTRTQASPTASKTMDGKTHNFCPTCGYKLSKNDKFCPNCGAPQ